MDMLGLKETIDQLATANGVRCYGHVLTRDDDSVFRFALDLEVSGNKKRRRPKKTWKWSKCKWSNGNGASNGANGDANGANGEGDKEDWFEG